MSNEAAAKELARLSYSDMREFAKQLHDTLENMTDKEVGASREQLCDALSMMSTVFTLRTGDQANDLLRKIFNKGRTKNIHVEVNAGGGFTVSFRNQTAHSVKLTDALNNLLDTLVSLQAMGVSL